MKKFVKISLIVVFVLAVVVLAGCTSNNNDSNTTSSDNNGWGDTTSNNHNDGSSGATIDDLAISPPPQIAEQQENWLTLTEIQGSRGVFLKRDDLFMRIESQNNAENLFDALTTTGNEYITTRLDMEFMHFRPSDRIVYVNRQPPAAHTLHRVHGTIVRGDWIMRTTQPMGGYGHRVTIDGLIYNYINGVQLGGGSNNNIPGMNQHGIPFTIAIIRTFYGEPGEIFTFGAWVGTNWYEREFAINAWQYSTHLIPSEITQTLNGYFYLDFTPPQNGEIFMISWDRHNGNWMGRGNMVPSTRATLFRVSAE